MLAAAWVSVPRRPTLPCVEARDAAVCAVAQSRAAVRAGRVADLDAGNGWVCRFRSVHRAASADDVVLTGVMLAILVAVALNPLLRPPVARTRSPYRTSHRPSLPAFCNSHQRKNIMNYWNEWEGFGQEYPDQAPPPEQEKQPGWHPEQRGPYEMYWDGREYTQTRSAETPAQAEPTQQANRKNYPALLRSEHQVSRLGRLLRVQKLHR